jgi:hypothetical protein
VGALVAMGIVAMFMEMADKNGWIPHRRVATVWISESWFQGEQKRCRLLTDLQSPSLLCDQNAQAQKRAVEFRGSLHAVSWECQLKSDLIACRAM